MSDHTSSAAKFDPDPEATPPDFTVPGDDLGEGVSESAASTDPTAGLFHLRSGFYFGREGDEVVIAHRHPALERAGVSVVDMVEVIRVPVHEWASVVASTTAAGETTETYWTAVTFLGSAGTPGESAAQDRADDGAQRLAEGARGVARASRKAGDEHPVHPAAPDAGSAATTTPLVVTVVGGKPIPTSNPTLVKWVRRV